GRLLLLRGDGRAVPVGGAVHLVAGYRQGNESGARLTSDGGKMELRKLNMGLALALIGAAPAGAVVPGFAGNITGGGNAAPVVVSTLSAMQTAVNNYNGTSGLVIQYNGWFDEAPILANICGQWSK